MTTPELVGISNERHIHHVQLRAVTLDPLRSYVIATAENEDNIPGVGGMFYAFSDFL
jgi:hypothetical protein